MGHRRSKNGPASLWRGGKGGRSLLGTLGFRSAAKRNKISFANKHDHCNDSIYPTMVQKSDQDGVILPIPPSLQITHFQSFTEVKWPHRSLVDEESEITGSLPPTLPCPPPENAKVCEGTSTESSSTGSASLTTNDNKSNSAAEYPHQLREANLLREMFHDLTCRCFTANEPCG